MNALQEIEEQAMHLDQAERALLAEHLIASIDSGDDIDAEELWLKEAERRYQAYRNGHATASPADEVFLRAAQALK